MAIHSPYLRCIRALLAAASLLAFSTAAPRQTPLHLHGHVSDPSGHPIPSATIVAQGSYGQVATFADSNGRFELDYPTPTAALAFHWNDRSTH